MTSNVLLNEENEQLAKLVNMAYRSYLFTDLESANKYGREWLLAVGNYALYEFTETIDAGEYTACMELFRQSYEENRSYWEHSDGALEKILLETIDDQPEDFYDIFLTLESMAPKSEDELIELFSYR